MTVSSSSVPTEQVRISVLGSMTVTVGGRTVALGGPGARAVIARLLVAAGHVVSTDLLIEDLWSGQPPPKALSALQVHVSNLRRILEPSRAPRTPATVIVSSPPGYALHLRTDAVDSWLFEHLATHGIATSDQAERISTLTDALDLWQGIPYHEHMDSGWARIESERLSELRATALEVRAHAYLDAGDIDRVVDDLGHHVKKHPGREFAVRLLALAQYRHGRQAAALSTMRRTRQYLLDELGVDPSPELQQLERDILQQLPSLSPGRVDSAGPVQHQVRPDVRWVSSTVSGRRSELEKLHALAMEAKTDGLRIAWIEGDAGEGKSALSRTFVEALTSAGWQSAWGACPEVDGTPPGWPWIEILQQLGDEPPSRTPFDISRSAEHQLSSSERPTVIVIDDIHRADEPTLQVLRQLVSSSGTSTSIVLCTFRNSEVPPELRATWAATAGTPSLRISLAGLDREGAESIARSSGMSVLTDDVMTELLERTGGNPLFLKEYSRLIASEGEAALRSTVPDGVREVLGRRISRLPDKTVVELRRASVLGRECDLSVLGDISNADDDMLLDALEPAVVAGIVVEPSPDRVRFSHDLIRETLYDSLPRMRRRRLHAAALETLTRLSPFDFAALAHHAIESATPGTAAYSIGHVLTAAQDAETQSSYREAYSLWVAAQSLSEMAVETNSDTLLHILINRVGAQARTGDVVGARATRLHALRLAQQNTDNRAPLQALTAWNAPVVWSIRVDPEPDLTILDAIDSALNSTVPTDDERALLLVTKVFELEGLDDTASLETARQARQSAHGIADPNIVMRVMNAFGYIAFGPDMATERITNAQELLHTALTVGDEGFASLAYFQLFLAAAAETDFDAAYANAALAINHAIGHQLTQMLGVFAVFDAMVDVMAGRTESAVRRYDAIAAAMHTQGVASAQWIGLIGRIGVSVMQDNLSTLVDELETLEKMRPHSVRFPLILALLDNGNTTRAQHLWSTSTPFSRDYYWLAMTTFQARAAARLGHADASRKLYEELLPFAGHIAGLDSGSFYAGPVDSALADIADLLGDADAAAAWRAAASELTKRTKERLHDAVPTVPQAPRGGREHAGSEHR